MRLSRQTSWGWVVSGLITAAAVPSAFAADASPAPVASQPSASATADGVSLAPTDAAMIISVSNIRAVGQKLSQLNDNAGLGVAPFNDVAGQLRSALRASRGVREDGPMALVIPGGAAAQGAFDFVALSKVLVLTTTDYPSLVSGLGGDATGSSTELHPPGGRPGFARSYPSGAVAFSGRRDAIETYNPSGASATQILTNAGPLGAKLLTKSDLTIYLNMTALGPSLSKSVAASVEEADKAIDATAKTNEAAATVLKKAWNRLHAEALKAFLRDATAVVIALDFTENSVVVTASAQFRPGSFMATAVNGNGDVTGLLAKFPQDVFNMAFVANTNALGVKQALEEASAKMSAPDRATPEAKLLKKAVALFEKTRSVGHVAYAALGASTTEPNLWLFDTTDSKAFISAFRDLVTAFPEYQPMVTLPASMGGTGAAPATKSGKDGGTGYKATSNYSPNVLSVDGSSVDQYELTFAAPEGFAKSLPPRFQPFFADLMGGGRTGFLSSYGNIVVLTTGPDAQILRQAMLAAKHAAGLGSEGLIADLRALQPAKPAFESFISLTTISEAYAKWRGYFATPSLPVPQNVLPISVSGYTEGGGATLRAILPHRNIAFLSEQRGWYAALILPPPANGKLMYNPAAPTPSATPANPGTPATPAAPAAAPAGPVGGPNPNMPPALPPGAGRQGATP